MKKVISLVLNDIRNDNRVLNQAKSLQQNGFNVTLIGVKSYAEIPKTETWEGVNIKRINIVYRNPLTHRIPFFKPVFHSLNLMIQFLVSSKLKGDIVHCHDLNTLQFGFAIKLLRLGRIKLIYDAHEYETQKNGLHGWRKKFSKIKERLLIKYCDHVITVSDTIADEYVRLYNIERPVVIFNCPILRTKELMKKDIFREKFGIPNSKKIYLYQGYLYPGRGIEVVLEAFDRLELTEAVLVFMGEGDLTSEISKHKRYGESVFIHPFVSGEVLLNYTSSADCGIAFIEDISLSDRYCMPNKLFEYIAAGLPVISSGLPDLKKFINTHHVGAAADSNDVDGFIQAFNNLPSLDSPDLAKNILNTRALFNWSTQEKVLIELYGSFENKSPL